MYLLSTNIEKENEKGEGGCYRVLEEGFGVGAMVARESGGKTQRGWTVEGGDAHKQGVFNSPFPPTKKQAHQHKRQLGKTAPAARVLSSKTLQRPRRHVRTRTRQFVQCFFYSARHTHKILPRKSKHGQTRSGHTSYV